MKVEEEIELKGKVKEMELKIEALIEALSKEGVITKKDIEIEMEDIAEGKK